MTSAIQRQSMHWLLLALASVVMVAFALRLGSNILETGAVFDERFTRIPIEDLVHHGWSVETAIDFKETKGPALIWPYALIAAVIGEDLNDLRLISLLFFLLGALPLLCIALRCGVRGPPLVIIALLYALLPYNAVLGQLVMSEPSFVFGSLTLAWVFLWGFGEKAEEERRVAGPIVVAIVLSFLLHNRIHAVAFAGAICLITFERDRFRSWPWWAACLLAGLSRLPLVIRWGGLINPDPSWQVENMHGLGLRLESLTYLAAAMTPYLALFLWPVLRAGRSWRVIATLVAAGGVGLVLGVVASPDLTLGGADERFQGPIATAVRMLGSSSTIQTLALAALAAVGLSSLAAVGILAIQRPPGDCLGTVARWSFWSLFVGWALYAFTRGWVFDRYLLPWAALVTLLWLRWLPRPLLWLQTLILAAIAARHVGVWLYAGGPGPG